jgi:hypothetical protein
MRAPENLNLGVRSLGRLCNFGKQMFGLTELAPMRDGWGLAE